MARMKRSMAILDTAKKRLAGLQSIDTALDFGESLTVPNYALQIQALENNINSYNTLLSQVDEALSKIVEGEKHLNDTSERMLGGVAVKFGKNSEKYEMAGGTKKSQHKKAVKKVIMA